MIRKCCVKSMRFTQRFALPELALQCTRTMRAVTVLG